MKRFVLVLMFALVGCGGLNSAFHYPPPGDIQIKQVLREQQSYMGSDVRWGGKVISVINEPESSFIELVQFPLNRYGRPLANEPSQGRFLVQSDLFLDPEVYKEGVMVTFIGRVRSVDTQLVDQRQISVPVITMEKSRAWVDKYTGQDRPYNPRQDAPFVGFGYYATGSYTP